MLPFEPIVIQFIIWTCCCVGIYNILHSKIEYMMKCRVDDTDFVQLEEIIDKDEPSIFSQLHQNVELLLFLNRNVRHEESIPSILMWIDQNPDFIYGEKRINPEILMEILSSEQPLNVLHIILEYPNLLDLDPKIFAKILGSNYPITIFSELHKNFDFWVRFPDKLLLVLDFEKGGLLKDINSFLLSKFHSDANWLTIIFL